jgi:hypothetical protein
MSRLTFTPGNHAYWLMDPDTGKRGRVPSVTTLLNQLAKPALVKWAARVAAEYAQDYWDDLALKPASERVRLITAAPEDAKNKAAAKGTHIHALAEHLLAGDAVEIPADLQDTVTGFARWWTASGFEVLQTEAMVWSEKDDLGGCAYAGTCDLIARHPRYGRTILDWKTGGVWPEHGVQVAAYADAEWVVHDGTDQPMTTPTGRPPIDTLAVARISPDGVALHILTDDQRHTASNRFLLLRALRDMPNPEMKEVYA